MPAITADQLRDRWDRGDRADVTAIIDGGCVDLDENGTPLDDQWEIIAEQIAIGDGEDEPGEPDPELPRGDLSEVAEEVLADTQITEEELKIYRLLDELEGAVERLRETKAEVVEADETLAVAKPVEETEGWWEWSLPMAQRLLAYARGEADVAERRLHELIRAAIAAKVPVTRIADKTLLSRERIYQIRDGRR